MDNRTQILEQALLLFARRGYDGVGVQQLAIAAGVTKPTLYHYFGCKEGLLECLLTEHAQQLHSALAAATQAEGALPEALSLIIHAYFEFAQRHTELVRLHLALVFAPRESPGYEIAARVAEVAHQLLVAFFAQRVPQARAPFLAVSLVGLLNTFTALYLNGYVELNETLRQELLAQFLHGLAP